MRTSGLPPAPPARALHRLGAEELDLASASRTLGAVVKYREDTDRVRQALEQALQPGSGKGDIGLIPEAAAQRLFAAP